MEIEISCISCGKPLARSEMILEQSEGELLCDECYQELKRKLKEDKIRGEQYGDPDYSD